MSPVLSYKLNNIHKPTNHIKKEEEADKSQTKLSTEMHKKRITQREKNEYSEILVSCDEDIDCELR